MSAMPRVRSLPSTRQGRALRRQAIVRDEEAGSQQQSRDHEDAEAGPRRPPSGRALSVRSNVADEQACLPCDDYVGLVVLAVNSFGNEEGVMSPSANLWAWPAEAPM